LKKEGPRSREEDSSGGGRLAFEREGAARELDEAEDAVDDHAADEDLL